MNLELCNDPPVDGPIHFYEIRHYWLSNFSSFAVRFGPILYPTSEHAYHVQKFPTSARIRTEIQNATSAHMAMLIARKNSDWVVRNWDVMKRQIMKEIVRAKLNQHEYIQKKLRQTGSKELIEVSPVDSYWGWGPDHNGQNELGKIWMELRSEMIALSPSPATPGREA